MNHYPMGDEGFDKSKVRLDRRAFFRESLLIGAHLHLEDRLIVDAANRDALLDGRIAPPVPQFVQLSMTNALTTGFIADESDGLLTPTFSTCFTNPEPLKSRFSGEGYHEKLFIHIPTNQLTIPRDVDEIRNMPISEIIYLEYRLPTLSASRLFMRTITKRYVVTPYDVSMYTSYDVSETQHDEVDLMISDPKRVTATYEQESSEISFAIGAIDRWDETPMTYIKSKPNNIVS